MNRYLPDNIDEFFSGQLKNYSEEPGESVWNEIDKRLSADQGNKRLTPSVVIMRAAVMLLVYLSIPFLIKDNFIHHNILTQNKIISHLSNDYQKIPEAILINTPEMSDYFKNKAVSKQGAIPASLQNSLVENYLIIKLPKNINNNSVIKQPYPDGLLSHNFLKDDLTENNKVNEHAPASINIKLHSKHLFSLTPFFSVDHITGRFIEQYEFDNLDKNDLAGREKPDMSFTAGLLAGYQLNKKLSLISGISYSSSKLSVAGAAVKALQNDNGKYIFKMATSYGFTELTKSGIVPAAGDSLLVSSANVSFNYISIPLMINYDLPGKKLRFSAHGGVAFNTITSEKVEAEYKVQNNKEAETINKIEGIRKTFFTMNTGIDVKYSINHTTDISIGPELRYGINSINKGTPVKTYPVNYGLSLKMNFKL